MLRAVLDREILGRVLSRAAKLVSRVGKGAYIQPGVLLVSEGDYMSVFATDMDNWMVQRLPMYEGDEGKAYVPVKELVTVLKGADGGSVLLKREDSVLVVQIGEDATYKINLFSEEEFPVLPDTHIDEGLMLNMEVLLEGIEKVGWCAAKDDPRPFLTGIYLHTTGGELRFVASDGSVLGFYAQPDFSGELDVIMPANAQSLLKTLPKNQGLLSVHNRMIHLSVEDEPVSVVAILRGIDDEYVDYESIIPKEFVADAIVDTDILRRKLDRMLAMTPDGYEIDVELEDGEMVLKTLSAKGEGMERLKAETSGQIKVRLIGSHLIRMLKSISSDSVRLSFSGENTPIKVGPTDNERHFYLTLPIS
ncbi:MAG: hypothetical protein GXO39_01610 [Thermotogae bacterium]|nr:hypothetical protein [Thermotogota bacterium]